MHSGRRLEVVLVVPHIGVEHVVVGEVLLAVQVVVEVVAVEVLVQVVAVEVLVEVVAVQDVQVVLETGSLTVTSAQPLDEATVRAAVEEAGYTLAS